MPRMKTETFGTGDLTWLASDHGIGNARTGTIDISTFTKVTHFPDGFIKAGTPVNCANEGAIAPWTDAAGQVLGFVLFDQATDGIADFAAPVLRHGLIKTSKIPGTFTKATGTTNGFNFI